MRVLALNGGGTAGIATCLILERLEAAAGKPIAELFDLVVGVSTGAIIGGAVCTGVSAIHLTDLYLHYIPLIFERRRSLWAWTNGYIGPSKYDHKPLEAMLANIFRHIQIGESKTDCMILATQVSPRVQPYFWKSWMSNGSPALFKDIIRASTAAPMYFEPKVIDDRVFVDGGIVANNPASVGLIEALKVRGDLGAITLVNIQLGDAPFYTPTQAHKLRSILPSAQMLIEMLLSANVEMSEFIAKNLLYHYINLDFNFSEPLDFWSQEFVNKARNMVEQLWAVHGNRLVNALVSAKDVKSAKDATTKHLPIVSSGPTNEERNDGITDVDQADISSDH
jgi:predicted acylesterase/phospholipase RssA